MCGCTVDKMVKVFAILLIIYKITNGKLQCEGGCGAKKKRENSKSNSNAKGYFRELN